MSDFINTIDALGDDAVMDSIIDRSITEFKDDKLTTVGRRAFHNCKNMTEVDLPNVTEIYDNAFSQSSISSVLNLPNVVTIWGSAFSGAKLPEKVYLPSYVGSSNLDNPQRIFESTSGIKHIDMPNCKFIQTRMFMNNSSLETVNMPMVEIIGQTAFGDYYGAGGNQLTKVDLPVCTKIAGSAFNKSKLVALMLRADSVCSLSDVNAFADTPIASGTGYIYVPSALIEDYKVATNWSTYAEQFRGIFEDEDVLQGIINENLVHLQSDKISRIPVRGCYNYSNIESVSSTSATEVKSQAFENCTALTSVNLPNVNLIEGNAFMGCSSLREVVFPSRVSDLCSHAFDNCTSLEYVEFSDVNFTAAHAYQFSNCTSLQAYINRGTVYCEQKPHLYIFRNTPIADPDGKGFVYVPRRMIDMYVNNNWAHLPATKYRAIEDYTVDGTITGELRKYAESIYLNASELTFTDSNSQTLVASGEFGMVDIIDWESSNTDVATVYNGVVTPRYDGTAIITAKNGNCVATCTVTVSGLGEMPVLLYSLPQQTTFNGTSDYIDTGIQLFDAPKSFTIVCSADFSKLSSNKCLFHCMNEATPYPGLSLDGNIGARVCYSGSTSLTTSITPASSISTLVLRYDAGVLNAIKYFDNGGALKSVDVNTNARYIAVTQNLILGAYQMTNGTKGRYYGGTIYSFDVYPYAMTDEQIAELI